MGGGAGALTRPCDVDAISSVVSVEKHTMLQQQSGDGDDMKTTDAGGSFTRGPWPAAAMLEQPWRLSCWVSVRVGEGSRAAGVANRWRGGARTNQALCSNQTNHVAELRILRKPSDHAIAYLA